MINQPTINDVIIRHQPTTNKPKLIYGYDTLCGWCYGFSEELKKAIHLLKNEVDFELVNVGLFAGIRGPKMGYMSSHIRRNMQSVTDRTGQIFGEGFLKLLDSINYPYNSMKASVAIEIVKDLRPEKVFDFAAKIQEAFFGEGKDIHSDEFYLDLIGDYDISLDQFVERLHSNCYENKAQKSFYDIQNYGFRGYPASAIKIGNSTKVLTEGFVTAEKLAHLIRQELKK